MLRPTALVPACLSTLLLACLSAACRFDPSGFPGDARSGSDARIDDAATADAATIDASATADATVLPDAPDPIIDAALPDGTDPLIDASSPCPSFCDTCDPLTLLCVVDCSGKRCSTGVDIICSPDWTCQIDCIGPNACRDGPVTCSGDCAITCSGIHSCEDGVCCNAGSCGDACTANSGGTCACL